MNHTYLTVDQGMDIHADAINAFGGALGIRDKNALESALRRVRSGYYDNLIQEASAMLESLVVNHPFIDGNKRVALFATDAFLELNGLRILCDPTNANRFIRNIITNKAARFKRIVAWLTVHTTPTNTPSSTIPASPQ